MKTTLLAQIGKVALLMLGIFVSTYAVVLSQNIAESAVPPNTVKAFKAASQGSSAKWKAGPSKSYEAFWAKDGKDMVYVFDQEGKLQQKKYVSAMASLPSSIPASVAAACPNGKVDGAYRVINRDNQKYIEVQVNNVKSIDNMRFDLTGKPLGKTTVAVVTPATKPVVATTVTKPTATPTVQNSVAMRGAAQPTLPTEEIVVEDEESDEDIKDLIEDASDLGDLLEEDTENWEDINLDEEDLEEDDSDLIDPNDGLDDMDLEDEDENEDDDGI